MLLILLDLAGIAVFAVSGALAAVRARLDVVGVIVLALITALGGGIIRDVLLDIHPPLSLRDWRYLLVPAVTGLLVFFFHPQVARLRRGVLIADALGLGLFSTSGTSAALVLGTPVYTACLIGIISAVGGGVLRDVLLREIPMVLRREIYALAALAGAVVVAVGAALGLPSGPDAVVGAVLAFGIRGLSLWRRWNAPTPRGA